MTREEERKILHECTEHNKCDKIAELYLKVVQNAVRKTFAMKHATLTKELLEDICQEVFAHLLDDQRKRLKQYTEQEGGSFAKWIAIVAGNIAKNYIRKKGYDSLTWQKSKISIGEDFEPSAPGRQESNILENISFNELMQEIPFFDRVIIKLYQYGLSSEEIADIVGSKQGPVNTRIWRIKQKLKKLSEK